MSDYFVLTEDKRCVPCEDPMEWAKAWGHKRIVKQDRLHRYNFLRYFGFPQPQPILISTVFLGINHNFGPDKDRHPLLFETMVFGGKYNELCQRYETYNEAVNGHEKVLKYVQGKITRL